ncbi:MAG: CHC2 zinc finger domain-containing protein [bacterium]
MKLDRDTIDKIKNNISIKEVISQYINVDSNNKAHCPFHEDKKTPSFSINEEKGYFKCFGCGKKGDVIDFIEKIENINFMEAIKKLTGKENIEFTFDKKKHILPENFMDLVQELKEMEYEEIFSEKILQRYQGKHKYLRDLGFKKEILDFFQLGYCDDIDDELFNRITIPWRNSKGELVAIIGRDVTDNSDIKYIAKKGSKKQKHLYNLNEAKKYGHQGLILVEDEKSVWRLRELGYKNAIAMGNCELGKRKWLLRKHTPIVYLCYDNDKAGKKALRKTIPKIYHIIKMYVIKLPDGYKDVAEIQNKELWEKCFKNKKKVIK